MSQKLEWAWKLCPKRSWKIRFSDINLNIVVVKSIVQSGNEGNINVKSNLRKDSRFTSPATSDSDGLIFIKAVKIWGVDL